MARAKRRLRRTTTSIDSPKSDRFSPLPPLKFPPQPEWWTKIQTRFKPPRSPRVFPRQETSFRRRQGRSRLSMFLFCLRLLVMGTVVAIGCSFIGFFCTRVILWFFGLFAR